ncbi:MAG: hypothetical protein GXY52_05010 [Chloroflexi bacterium]|nr:hypothetical protein [Chloroflexota bacterium]
MDWKSKLIAIANRLRIVGIIIFVLILVAAGWQVYIIIRNSTGMNASHTAVAWFTAFDRGDYDTVYNLTAKADLVDLYGRPISREAFTRQLARLHDPVLKMSNIQANLIYETRGRQYFAVTWKSGSGTLSVTRVVVEVRSENNQWVVTCPFAIKL